MSAPSPKRHDRGRESDPAPDDGRQRVRLRFLPDGGAHAHLEVRVPSGTPVFDAASWNGIAIDSTCGGHGTCKKCKVRVISGDVPVGPIDPRAFTADELRDGWRLACRASARTDLVVEVPPLQTRPKAALAGVGRHVILRPAVQKRHLVLAEPTLEDQRSDLQRVLDGVDDLEPHTSIEVLRSLGGTLRASGFDVTAVVCDEELIDVEPGDTTARRFAIAFDLGTTTVVATLLDLDSGQPVAVRSMLNRQQPYGADVITRISATMMDDHALAALSERAHETVAELTAEVCTEAGIDPREVYEITVCGNVTMMQLALGVDPEPLSMAPFVVASHELPPVRAADFGVEVHPRAPAFVFPSLGAYVGGDIVAGMLATGLTRDRRLRLFIDVGTNSEIALGSSERVLATAAPAGPAFEAAQIKCGMRAADGAIEGLKIDGDALELEVIGDVEAVGMCGSGLVDAVSELVQAGLLDRSGRFIPDEDAAALHPALATRLTTIGKERVFVLHWRGKDPETSVYLSQRDVRELQFAKASIATGWQILLRELGAAPEEITQV
ncbi:MAG TPA: ASKHA domain-containing protein, partial [Solirubrobacteraceae bacterium]|nr:ASKHA domain-containing protein [Solirubrobacteraceae bacterium]